MRGKLDPKPLNLQPARRPSHLSFGVGGVGRKLSETLRRSPRQLGGPVGGLVPDFVYYNPKAGSIPGHPGRRGIPEPPCAGSGRLLGSVGGPAFCDGKNQNLPRALNSQTCLAGILGQRLYSRRLLNPDLADPVEQIHERKPESLDFVSTWLEHLASPHTSPSLISSFSLTPSPPPSQGVADFLAGSRSGRAGTIRRAKGRSPHASPMFVLARNTQPDLVAAHMTRSEMNLCPGLSAQIVPERKPKLRMHMRSAGCAYSVCSYCMSHNVPSHEPYILLGNIQRHILTGAHGLASDVSQTHFKLFYSLPVLPPRCPRFFCGQQDVAQGGLEL